MGTLSAGAQSRFPDKPVKLVVPYAAGGAVDIYVRTVQPALSRELVGQPVIVENKPGASGMLGADQVATASPDGYMLIKSRTGIDMFTCPTKAWAPSCQT